MHKGPVPLCREFKLCEFEASVCSTRISVFMTCKMTSIARSNAIEPVKRKHRSARHRDVFDTLHNTLKNMKRCWDTFCGVDIETDKFVEEISEKRDLQSRDSMAHGARMQESAVQAQREKQAGKQTFGANGEERQVDVGNHTALGDGDGTEELIRWHESEMREKGRKRAPCPTLCHPRRCTGADTLCIVALLQQAVDMTDGKLETSFGDWDLDASPEPAALPDLNLPLTFPFWSQEKGTVRPMATDAWYCTLSARESRITIVRQTKRLEKTVEEHEIVGS
ncbi:hypothetical protein K438DRAFT_2120493 [Mycena galopus ATCC 62051]|nr:hypothetical protein K438DRAFT_2120493 [Mycena galopus ATCC 62051]